MRGFLVLKEVFDILFFVSLVLLIRLKFEFVWIVWKCSMPHEGLFLIVGK